MANNPTIGRPSARHLVLLGTPNHRTPCASRMIELDLASDHDPAEVFFDQTPALMSLFNTEVTNLKGVQAFAAAGDGVYTGAIAAPAGAVGAGLVEVTVEGQRWMLPLDVAPAQPVTALVAR